jgi:DNA end-binding protein Ku
VINLMDALKQSLKSKTAKRPVHAPTRRARHRPVKKAHRSVARARKAS